MNENTSLPSTPLLCVVSPSSMLAKFLDPLSLESLAGLLRRGKSVIGVFDIGLSL